MKKSARDLRASWMFWQSLGLLTAGLAIIPAAVNAIVNHNAESGGLVAAVVVLGSLGLLFTGIGVVQFERYRKAWKRERHWPTLEEIEAKARAAGRLDERRNPNR